MTPEIVQSLFTRRDGSYGFARWGRPIAPIVFGVEDQTLTLVHEAVAAMAGMVNHPVMETDAEFGSNLWVFFLRDWDELRGVDEIEQLVPGISDRVDALSTAKANQYRLFRFDDDGAIKVSFVFLRMDAAMSARPADEIIIEQIARIMVSWGEDAFAKRSILATNDANAPAVLHPDIVQILQAAYAPNMPVSADDPSHGLRLFARLGRG